MGRLTVLFVGILLGFDAYGVSPDPLGLQIKRSEASCIMNLNLHASRSNLNGRIRNNEDPDVQEFELEKWLSSREAKATLPYLPSLPGKA